MSEGRAEQFGAQNFAFSHQNLQPSHHLDWGRKTVPSLLWALIFRCGRTGRLHLQSHATPRNELVIEQPSNKSSACQETVVPFTGQYEARGGLLPCPSSTPPPGRLSFFTGIPSNVNSKAGDSSLNMADICIFHRLEPLGAVLRLLFYLLTLFLGSTSTP
jgi:hypothetical protein